MWPDRSLLRRLLIGCVVYWILALLWRGSGAAEAADALILQAARLVEPWISHFPLEPSNSRPVMHTNQAVVVPWAVALALVVRGVGWVGRVARYGVLASVVLLGQILALAIQIGLATQFKFQNNSRVQIMPAWEIWVNRALIESLFLVGIHVAPFLVLALTTYWSLDGASGRPAATDRRKGKGWLAAAGLLLATGVSIGVAHQLRERHPRHVRGHQVIGQLYERQQQWDVAATEFRAALSHRPDDGETWMRLARALDNDGRPEQAQRVRKEALARVTDPRWRRLLQAP